MEIKWGIEDAAFNYILACGVLRKVSAIKLVVDVVSPILSSTLKDCMFPKFSKYSRHPTGNHCPCTIPVGCYGHV